MRISDWSSDVCSSDLTTESLRQQGSGRLSGLADGFRTLGPREAQADRQLRGGRGRRLSERRSDPKPVSSSLAHPLLRRDRFLPRRRFLWAQPVEAHLSHRVGEYAQASSAGLGKKSVEWKSDL